MPSPSENDETVLNMSQTSLSFSFKQLLSVLIYFALMLLWFARLESRTFANQNDLENIKDERAVEKVTHQKDRELIIRIDSTVQSISKQIDKLEK